MSPIEHSQDYEDGALDALDYITDERPDLEALTMSVAEKIGADILTGHRHHLGAVEANERVREFAVSLLRRDGDFPSAHDIAEDLLTLVRVGGLDMGRGDRMSVTRHSKHCVDANFPETGDAYICVCFEGHPDDAPSDGEMEIAQLRRQLRGAVEAEREWCLRILDVDQRDAGDGRLLATLANMAAVRLEELGGR